MPLSPGAKLGPYEIQAAAGVGGMGEVYRARDTRLERTVAIKVLPAHLSGNPEQRQRLEREARAVSALNHAHICTLYDVGQHNGADYLVLEYLEGETLAQRLQKGPLPAGELLQRAIEIADALERAHRHGIVHRDLKPGNIMLTKSGAKLLDFGLAKPQGSAVSSDLAATLTSGKPLTAEGTIVGTFQYMSPEQLEGREADERSDIFSFGAVLYEMATAKRAFEGQSQASLIAAILSATPAPITTLQPMAPPALERVVKTCLAKDPDERWQTAHDLKLQLQWIAEGGSQAGIPAPLAARRRYRDVILAASAAVAILAAVAFAVLYFMRAPVQQPLIRAYIKPAGELILSSFNGGTAGFAISPDGSRLTYAASGTNGVSVLWVRRLDSLQAEPLEGTNGATLPFWSADSRFIGFFAEGKLKKIDASGGPPLTLCDAPGGRGGTWNRDGTILFAPFFSTPIYKIPDAGGTPVSVTTIDRAKNESTHRWPWFLPDGRHFLYMAGNPFTPAGTPANSIMVGSLDSPKAKFLFHSSSNAIYASGYLLFLQQNTLMAQPFSTSSLDVTGEAAPVADQVEDVTTRVQGSFSASANGNLTYLGTMDADRQLLWFDRNGKQVAAVPGTDAYDDPHISPNGKQLAFVLVSNATDIWLYDMARDVRTKFTFGSGHEGPVWSPDGRSIAYTAIRNGQFGIYQRAADGSGAEKILVGSRTEQVFALDWSPDGQLLAYIDSPGGSMSQLKVLSLRTMSSSSALGSAQESRLSSTQTVAHFSPDGKWLAYTSEESGGPEVYVTPFPGPGGKWQVSNGGGRSPQWRRDGRELFYISADNKIMSAEVRANGSSFTVGAVKPLFQAKPYFGLFTANLFDVTADGQRFIIPSDKGQSGRTITLIANWPAALKKQ